MLSATVTLFAAMVTSLAQPAKPVLVSQAPFVQSSTAFGDSGAPVMSANGRYLVFQSTAENLVTNSIKRGLANLFLGDNSAGTIALISVNTNGLGANGRSYAPSASADGQQIAFVSEATDLVSIGTNAVPNVFVRSVKDGTTRLVSHGVDGLGGNGPSTSPLITADGQFVFFESDASDLVKGDTNQLTDVFRFELATGETTLVSDTGTNRLFRSWLPQVSEDGTKALFRSEARSVGAPRPGVYITYRDLATTSNLVVNSLLDPLLAPSTSPVPVLSGDGRVAAYVATVTSAGGTNAGLYRVALPNGPAELLATNLNTFFRVSRGAWGLLAISDDGSLVTFEAISRSLASGPEAVYQWDATSRDLTLVSSNTVWASGFAVQQPFGLFAGANPTGRYVAWLSYSTNGVTHPSNAPLQLFVQDRTTGETRLITRTPSGTPSRWTTDAPSVSFSADGQLLAFHSAASDLVAGDDNGNNDVFLYSWASDRLDLVSRRLESLTSQTAPGFQTAGANCLSADGRFIVFISSATGLTKDDPAGVPNVFIRDLVTGSNQLVSANLDATAPANGTCRQAVISADGRWVAFTSLATNLVANDTNGVEDVFLRDLGAGRTVLVSHTPAGQSGNAESFAPSISPDGRRVAFVSSASNLVTLDSNSMPDVFLFDRINAGVRLVSATPTGVSGTGNSYHPLFTPDGNWLVFESAAADLLTNRAPLGVQVYAWHVADAALHLLAREMNSNRRVPRPIAFSSDSGTVVFNVQNTLTPSLALHFLGTEQTLDLGLPFLNSTWGGPSLNSDGTEMAFVGLVPGSTIPQIEVLDRVRNQTNVVSTPTGAPTLANGPCANPVITPDGRFVVFSSKASNLVNGDDNALTDIFVRDLQAGTTLLLSQSLFGYRPGNALSGMPILGADGRTVLFTSYASDLVDGDYNGQADLFLVRLPGPESGFRVLSITSLATGQVALVWTARSGASYRVEYTDALGATWQPLNTSITVNPDVTQATAIDASVPGHATRFYRVLQE